MEFDLVRWAARSAVAGGAVALATVLPWVVPPIGIHGNVAPPAADAVRPFGGSPADRWRDGELGLVTPEPRAVAGFTTEELRLAYWHVRQVLSAANVDGRAVYAGDVSTLAGLLRGQSPRRDWATAFVAGTTPSTDVPKVKGTITARAVAPGAVRVRARHLFVYALRPPDGRQGVKRVVVARRTTLLVYRAGPAVGVRLEATDRTALGASCTAAGLRPNFGVLPSRAPRAPYEAAKPASGTCRPDAVT